MAKMRYRKPSPKTLLGWTKLKKRVKKALGVNAVLRPFRALGNYKRRMLRGVGYYSPEMKMVRAAQRKQVPGPIGPLQLGEREGKEQKDRQSGMNPLLMAAALGQGRGAQAKGRKKNGLGAKLAGAFLIGSALNTEHKKQASRNNHAHAASAVEERETAHEHRAAVEEKPAHQPEPPQRRPPSRSRWPVALLIVIVLGAIGFIWLNSQLAPADMLHFSLSAGGQGARFVQFTVQRGQQTLIHLGVDATQLLLVLGVALIETLLIGLLLDRASFFRLIESLVWALIGIGIAEWIVPQLWHGDHLIDGVPFFTVVIGAFVTLFVHHLLRSGPPKAAAPVLAPPVSPPMQDERAAGVAVAPPVVAAPPVAAPGATVPGVQLFFHSQRAGLDNALVGQLVSFIMATEHSLDCAIYDLRHPQVLQALASVAHGKHLRIAYDAGKVKLGADPKPGGNEEAIQQAGLSSHAVSIHEGSHLMHNKFLIRDGRTVWTGSANFTSGGLELQDNNCLIVDSPELAQQYEATFTDLISGNHEHKAARGNERLGQAVRLGAATITPDFAPRAGEGIEDTVMSLLKDAHRVRILAFLIGDSGILQALEAVKHADVKGVYDPNGMEDVLRFSRQDHSHFWFMHDSRFVAAPSHAFHGNGEQDFMHNKVFIINDEWVVTGSYNFSENAEANDENVLIIQSPPIAAAYTGYFDALYRAYGGH